VARSLEGCEGHEKWLFVGSELGSVDWHAFGDRNVDSEGSVLTVKSKCLMGWSQIQKNCIFHKKRFPCIQLQVKVPVEKGDTRCDFWWL